MIDRAEAVVLRAQDWAETSRLVHTFSRQHGLVKLVAKGARRPKSRFGASLEPGTVVQAVFYRSRTSDLHTVSEAAISWRPLSGDRSLERIRVISAGLEIPLRAAAPETPILALFRNLAAFLKAVDGAPERRHPRLLLDFTLHAVKNLGYHPSLDRCVGCRGSISDRAAGFSLDGGGLVCHRCGGRHRELVSISVGQARALTGWLAEGELGALSGHETVSLVKLMMIFLNRQLSDRVKLQSFRTL